MIMRSNLIFPYLRTRTSASHPSLSMEGLQRDLNYHKYTIPPRYGENHRLDVRQDRMPKPSRRHRTTEDFRRQRKQIPASWITAQMTMTAIGVSLKRTDQSEILQGDVSLSYIANICNYKVPRNERTVNGTTLFSLKRKGIVLLSHVGIRRMKSDGTFNINTSLESDGRWTPAATANWKKLKKMLEVT